MENLTRTQKRELRRQAQGSHHHHLKNRQALTIAVIIAILLMAAGYIGYAVNNWRKTLPARSYTDGPVHWHARVNVEICGKSVELPESNILTAHGSSAVGEPLLHHHHDGLAHIEGKVLRAEDISIGRFFEAIGSKFSKTELFDKKNGDTCANNKAGRVVFFVNDEESQEFGNYILKDGDKIDVKFE